MERPRPIRRNTYTKLEGDFFDETTSKTEFVDYQEVERAQMIKQADNLVVGREEYIVSENVFTYA